MKKASRATPATADSISETKAPTVARGPVPCGPQRSRGRDDPLLCCCPCPYLPRCCLWPSPRCACSICSLVRLGALRSIGRRGGSVLVELPCAAGRWPESSVCQRGRSSCLLSSSSAHNGHPPWSRHSLKHLARTEVPRNEPRRRRRPGAGMLKKMKTGPRKDRLIVASSQLSASATWRSRALSLRAFATGRQRGRQLGPSPSGLRARHRS